MKCFLEDLPAHTLVVATYSSVLEAGGPEEGSLEGAGMQVEASDPFETVLVAKTTEMEGRFAFTTEHAGEHTICFKTNTTHWFGGQSA